MKYLISLMLSLAAASNAVAAPDTLQAQAPNGAIITLTQQKGPCEGPAKLATHLAPDKKTVTKGCWKVSDNGVLSIAWLDGDGSAIPIQVFQPAPGI